MLKENDVPPSNQAEIDRAMAAPKVLGKIRGVADGDALIAAEELRQRILSGYIAGVTGEQLCPMVLRNLWLKFAGPYNPGHAEYESGESGLPGPHQRVARIIADVSKNSKCLCENGWNTLTRHALAFAHAAEDCIEHFDGPGLDRAIAAFTDGADAATKISSPPHAPTED